MSQEQWLTTMRIKSDFDPTDTPWNALADLASNDNGALILSVDIQPAAPILNGLDGDGNKIMKVYWPDWSGESTDNGGLVYGLQIDDANGNNMDMQWYATEEARDEEFDDLVMEEISVRQHKYYVLGIGEGNPEVFGPLPDEESQEKTAQGHIEADFGKEFIYVTVDPNGEIEVSQP